jgi:hypothetical protein
MRAGSGRLDHSAGNEATRRGSAIVDREQFDALTRLIGAKGTRRSALVALLSTLVLHQEPESIRAGGLTRKGKGNGNGNVHHHKRRKGKRRRRSVAPPPRVTPRPLTPVVVNCFPGATCNFPGAGVVAKGCDFSDSDTFRDLDVSGAIFSGSNFTAADLAGADLRGALLDGACLVGADLFDARLDTSTLLEGAIFCNTVMPDGSRNDTGCSRGNSCCPTCVAPRPCGAGQICCHGRCLAGVCCDDRDCPEHAVCTGGACVCAPHYYPCGRSGVCIPDDTCCDDPDTCPENETCTGLGGACVFPCTSTAQCQSFGCFACAVISTGDIVCIGNPTDRSCGVCPHGQVCFAGHCAPICGPTTS